MRYAQHFISSLIIIVSLLSVTSKDVYAARLEGFTGSLLEDPNFFPLGVWTQLPENAEEYREIGINLYVGLWAGPTAAQLAKLKAAQMPTFSHQNNVGLSDPNNDMIIGWMMQDEPDNAQRIDGSNDYSVPIPPSEMLNRYREIRRNDPSRPVLMNLGQGVAWDQWHGRGPRSNHPEDYKEYVKAADIVSFDIYPVTHSAPVVRGRLDLVAKGTSRLVQWTENSKPVWSVIGASSIGSNVMPTGDQIRNQVWLSIIHGARGIIYFVHQFKPRFIEAALLQNDSLKIAVKNINLRITSLAPVLNGPDIEGMATVYSLAEYVSGKPGIVSVLVKRDNCALYIFAASKSRFGGAFLFEVKQDIAIPELTVLDENRTVSIEGNKFQDYFDPYAAHLYKLQIGPRNCR